MADQNIKYRVTTTGTEKAAAGFKRLGLAIAGAFGGFALINELRKAGTAFIDLDKGMRLVNTITKVTGEELKKLTSDVIELSNQLGTPTSQMTGAIYQAVSAGVEFNKIMGFMKIATTAAIAGNANVEVSVDALTTIMNSFKAEGLKVIEVSDIMFKTIELGKTDMDKLAASYFNVAATASVAGIKFSELSAAISLLTLQGTKTSVAMTQLRQLVLALNKQLGDGWRETMTFQEGLQELIKRADGSDNALLKLVVSTEALAAALGLTGVNAKQFTGFLNQTSSAAGSTQKAFLEMEKSISKAIQNITTLIENKLIVVLETVLSNIVAIVKFVQDNDEIATILKLLAKPVFVGQGSLVSKDDERFEKIREHFEKINIEQGTLIDKTKDYSALLSANFGHIAGITLEWKKVTEGTENANNEVKKVLGETKLIKQKIAELKREIDGWTGKLTTLHSMTIEQRILEESLLPPIKIITEELEKQLALRAEISRRVLPHEAGRFIGEAEPAMRGGVKGRPSGNLFAGANAAKIIKDSKILGNSIFVGWSNVLVSNMNTAWAEIFGEANSLFEQLINSMVDLLVKDLFAGLLSFLPGGSVLSGVFSLFGGAIPPGGGGGGGGGSQTIVLEIGGRRMGEFVLEGNRQIQQLRLT